MNNPYRTLLAEMAAELDHSQQMLTDNRKATHPLADRARVLLDQPEPLPLPDNYIDPGHAVFDRELLEIFYTACQSEGGTADEITLRGIKAALAHPTAPPADGEVAQLQRRLKRLAHAATMEDWCEFDMRVPAEPLRDADLVLTRAADLLQRQPPQPPADGEVAVLTALVAVLRDEIDMNRRWEEVHDRAQQGIMALLLQGPQPVAVSERPWRRDGWCDDQGECWLETVTLFPDRPAWIKTCPAFAEKFPQCFVYVRSLPANALPTPEAP